MPCVVPVHPARTAVIGGSSLRRVPRTKVHDAALRTRLLECAGATLSAGGLAALSLRSLAAEVGTSTTAVYALFGGKSGLLEALHAEAFSRLGARLDAVLDQRRTVDDPVEGLVALGRAYRDSALANPHTYDVMFGESPVGRERWWAAAAPTVRPMARVVERALAVGALRPGSEPATVSLALWATVHGLVSLHLRGLRAVDDRAANGSSAEDVFELALRTAVAGWLSASGVAGRN